MMGNPGEPDRAAAPAGKPRDWSGALGSADHSIIGNELYAKGKTVHNKRIDGPFRRFKWLIMVVTLAIYYITPWIRWDRGPYAPDQAVSVFLGQSIVFFCTNKLCIEEENSDQKLKGKFATFRYSSFWNLYLSVDRNLGLTSSANCFKSSMALFRSFSL